MNEGERLVQDMLLKKSKDAQMDCIYDIIDGLCEKQEFEKAKEFLIAAIELNIGPSHLLCCLIISRCWRHELNGFHEVYYEQMKKHFLKSMDTNKVHELIKGLT